MNRSLVCVMSVVLFGAAHQVAVSEDVPQDQAARVGIAPPKKIEIPKDSWEPIYFRSINGLTEKVQWKPLREVGVPAGSLEVRVWIGFGLSSLQGYRLCRNGDTWTGVYVNANHFAIQEIWLKNQRQLNKKQKEIYESLYKESKPLYELTPQTGWENLWKKVEAFGILTLPDASTLPNRKNIRDGVGYVVEINDGEHYRTYLYSNPHYQEWPEATKILEIIATLSIEFRHSLPSRTGFQGGGG